MQSLVVGYAIIFAPVLIALVGCAIAGYLMLAPVDRRLAGVLLGFFLGPIGLLIAWPMRANALHEREQHDRFHRDIDEARPAAPLTRPTQPARSLTQELDELISQRARGQISADEYERRKTDLLGP